MTDQVPDVEPLPAEEPQVATPEPAPTNVTTAPVWPKPEVVATAPPISPISAILAALEGSLTEVEGAIDDHGTTLAPLIGEVADTAKAVMGSFATTSPMGKTLAAYVDRVDAIAQSIRDLTRKVEL